MNEAFFFFSSFPSKKSFFFHGGGDIFSTNLFEKSLIVFLAFHRKTVVEIKQRYSIDRKKRRRRRFVLFAQK
jgi:hypothetical protein